LNLSIGQDFIANGHTIEFYGANGKVEKFHGTPGEFSTGTVHGDDDSHVALHHNDQGMVRIRFIHLFVKIYLRIIDRRAALLRAVYNCIW